MGGDDTFVSYIFYKNFFSTIYMEMELRVFFIIFERIFEWEK